MSSHTKALLALIFAALLWATAGVVAKVLIREFHPFVVTAYRFGIASLIILPFFLKEKKPKYFWRDLIPLSLLNSANVLFYYIGLTTTTANSAFIIGAANPLVTAIFSRLLIKERTSPTQIVGIITGLIGVLFIIVLPVLSAGKSLGGNLVGNIYVVAGTMSWVLYTIGSRHFISSGKYSPFVTASMNFFTTTAIAFLFAIITHQRLVSPALMQPKYIAVLLFAAIGITIITFSLFQWAVKHVTATTASLKDYIQLVAGVGLNTAILGEKLSAEFLLGSLLVVIGIIIATGQKISSKIRGLRSQPTPSI